MRLLPVELKSEFTSDWSLDLNWKNMKGDLWKEFTPFHWEITSDNSWWNRRLKRGEVACTISHFFCWRRAVEAGDDPFLILEDDISFVNGFMAKLRNALDQIRTRGICWDMLYLGREPLAKDERIFGGVVRPGFSYGSFAYMLTYQAATKLLKAGLERAVIPIDEFLPAMYLDHPREDVRKRFPKRLSAYAVKPPIVKPLSQTVSGSDTEASDFI